MVNSIHDILNFRYNPKYLSWNISSDTLSKKQIEDTLLVKPYVFTNFKVIRLRQDTYINHNSITNDVFCDVKRLDKIKNTLDRHRFPFNNLVCAGDDTLLSDNILHLKEIKHLFKKIYYEAKDIECDWVTTIPMGSIMVYMLRCGGDRILHHINKAKYKTKLIGVAFGSRWPQLTDKINDRKLLLEFAKNSQFMDDMFCKPLEYYQKLCEYKFFACPLGNGIQTPKICESIMCETVPVVTDHVAHRELRDFYDIPLLIVNKWSDLTEEFLNQAYESKYRYIDWQKEKSKFLVKNFGNLLK